MARTFKAFDRKGGNSRNQRIPLNKFREPIVILRAEATPSPTDASWIRKTKKIFQGMAAHESGEIKLVASEKQSDKELFLFVIHYQDGLTPTLADYIIWGNEVYHVQGYIPLGERGDYLQINTRSWGQLQEGDFVMDADADVPPSDIPESRDNLFWDTEPTS